MEWQIGDIAIYKGTEILPFINAEVEIVALAPDPELPKDSDCAIRSEIDVSPHTSGAWAAVQKDLVPLDDPMEKSTWDNCVFKPKELITCTD